MGQRGVQVLSEHEVSRLPPKIDIVLLRRATAQWTPEQLELLPDGIRDTEAKHVLIKFKYTESLTKEAIVQALGYEYFYRKANNLKQGEVKMFILCAKTPQAKRLQAFGYVETSLLGVLHSNQVINELRDVPHNAFVKAFASRTTQKEKAFSQIERIGQLSSELLTYFEVLRVIWSLPEGANMNEVLTPERVLEIGEEWTRMLIQNLSEEKLNELIAPEYKQGFIEQGISQKNRAIVHAMHTKGFDLDVIADITELTIEQVQALLAIDEAGDAAQTHGRNEQADT